MKRISTLCTVLALGSSVVAGDPCQVARLVTPEFEPNAFGISVTSSGDYWFVADHQAEVYCTGFGCGVGAVYVYEMVAGDLVYTQSLVSPLAQSPDNFGRSIAADDAFLVVGAPYSAAPGHTGRPGVVFVYRRIAGQWELDSTVEPPIGTQRFGELVAIDNGTLVVADKDQNRILVYARDGLGWSLADELLPPAEVSVDAVFGYSMVARDGRIVVGAPWDRSVIAAGGSFHIYREITEERYALEQSVYSAERQLLGSAVAIQGAELFVGAFGATRAFDEQGVVHHYRFDDLLWERAGELKSVEPFRGEAFGFSLAIDDNVLVTGTQGRNLVHTFRRDSEGQWEAAEILRPQTTTFPGFFGFALALQGQNLLVGAHDESDTFSTPDYGAAYLFDLTCNSCPPDLDADGRLTVFDFLTLLNLFDAGDMQADFDGDGELTVFDFLAFQTAFDAGCE